MNINATLFLQAIVFAILVWFTMRYIWPPITASPSSPNSCWRTWTRIATGSR